MDELVWNNVLYCHSYLGWRGIMWEYAQKLGYPYFAWNGIIYDAKTDIPLKHKNDEYVTIGDVK